MKRKRLILTILSLVVILSLSSLVLWRYLSGKYVETAESIRDYFMWPTYQRLPLEYYNSFGYYPRSMDEAVDFYQKDTTGKASKVQIRDETAYSQTAVCNATLALEQTEQMPSFQSGDMKAFHNWVNSQIRYPAEAFKNNLGGKVVAQFTVDQAGSVGDIKILQSPDKCFSDEVTRILESSPKWTPGRDEKGDAVKVSLVIPVDFRMTAEKPSEN